MNELGITVSETWGNRISFHLPRLSSVATIILVGCTPFPGEYQRIGIAGLTILGFCRLITRQPPPKTKETKELAKLLLCFLIPALASLGHSVAVGSTLKFIASLGISAIIGSALLCGLGDKSSRDWQRKAISIIFAIWVTASCVYAATCIAINGQFVTTYPTLSILTSSLFGRILTMLMPLALWKLVTRRSPAGFALLLASGVATMLTGQRNNVLCYLLGACLLVNQMPRKAAIRWLAACIATLMLIYPFSGELNSRTTRMLATVQSKPGVVMLSARTGSDNTLTNKKDEEKSVVSKFNELSSERGFIYEAAIKMTAQSPITGVGAGTFRKAFELFATQKGRSAFATPPGPHNIYVSVIAQTGLMGIGGFLIAISLLIQWHRSSRNDAWRLEEAEPYSASLFVMLFPLITQDDLYSSFWWTMFIYLTCGLLGAKLLNKCQINTVERESSSSSRQKPSERWQDVPPRPQRAGS